MRLRVLHAGPWFMVLGLLVLSLMPVHAATYYVDQDGRGGSCNPNNPGTVTQPRCTIDQGVQLLSSGDTLYIRQATYDSQNIGQYGPTQVPNGNSWASATIIASYPGEIAVVYNAGISMVNGNSYIIFDRLKLELGSMYLDASAHHIRFQNGEICCWYPTDCVDGVCNTANLIQGQGSFLEVLNSKIHNSNSYGVYWRGNSSIFDGNEWYDLNGYSIHVYHYGESDVFDNVVRNNIVHGNGFGPDVPGWQIKGGIIISCGSGNKAYNNVIYGNYAGLQIDYRCHDCEVYNNTIYGNQGSGIIIGSSDVQNLILRNNISYGNGADWENNGGPGAILENSYNLIGHQGGQDPRFVNADAGDFHLQPLSPARDAGTPISLFSTDKAGTSRPQPAGGAWDIGAYEYIVGGTPTCPPDCPPTCPPDCPPGENPTINPVIVSAGGHGDTPSDSNGCRTAETPATPKATIASALGCMSVPSKKLWLRGGNHAGFVDTGTTPITGGPNWSAPTILESYPTEAAILQLPATNTGATLFFRAITDRYIHVRNLTLDGMSRTAAAGGGDGILIYGDSQFLRFENLTVRNDRYQNVVIIGASDIEVLTSTLTNALNNPNIRTYYEVHNLLFSGNTITTSPVAGIQLTEGAAQTDNVKIAKNTISGSPTGIDVGVSTGTLVQNNVIQGEPGNGIYLRSGAVGWQVYHNTVVSNTGTGLLCDAGATSGDFANNIAVANTAAQLVNNCAAQNRGNTLTGTLAQIFTTVPVLKESAPASPAINSGVNLPSVTDDQIGNARPFGTFWDAGAREAQVAGPPPVVPHVSVRVFMFF